MTGQEEQLGSVTECGWRPQGGDCLIHLGAPPLPVLYAIRPLKTQGVDLGQYCEVLHAVLSTS